MKKIIILIPIIIAVILLVIPYGAFAGNQLITVSSDSMSPTLIVGDLLVIEPIAIEYIKKGDIIAFDSHDPGILVHRVFEIFENDGKIGIDTKGDHNEEPDIWSIYDENLIGILVEVNPPMGILLSNYSQYPIVAVIVISIAILVREFIPKKGMEIEELHCLRCDYRWHPRIIDGKAKIPETCPEKKCRSPYWKTARKTDK